MKDRGRIVIIWWIKLDTREHGVCRIDWIVKDIPIKVVDNSLVVQNSKLIKPINYLAITGTRYLVNKIFFDNNLFDKARLSYNRCYSKIVRGIFQFQARYKRRIDESPISIDKKDKSACHRVSFAKSYVCIVVE